MKVAIVHYHLNHGGVGAVIAAASAALARAGIPHVVLIGPSPPRGNHHTVTSVCEVPGLEYRDSIKQGPHEGSSEPVPCAGSLEQRVRDAAGVALGAAPDVWFFHNHSLGKNPLIGELVARLAEAGERLILQIHDLAEDGRPANYQTIQDPQRLYPISDRIHYAFLNSRDLRIFTSAGLPEPSAHLLENPIDPPPAADPPQGDPLLFAPIRAIRRKNIGELVFLSALLPTGARVAVSRAPTNPAALAIHEKWSAFASENRLPIQFGVVDNLPPEPRGGRDFASWLAHATHIVSTSVAEGFGLPTLEAAAWRRPMLGRALPHLVNDHARHGIQPGWLYRGLMIPLDWVGANILREHIRSAIEANARVSGRPLVPGLETSIFRSLVREGWIDFGNLPEALQQGVIEQLRAPINRQVPSVITEGTPRAAIDWLHTVLENRRPSASTDALHPHLPETYQKNLLGLLEKSTSPASGGPLRFIDPERILEAFSGAEAFHFLCSAPRIPASHVRPWRAVIFDIYGTLLIAPAGGVQPDPSADPLLRRLIRRHGRTPPESPSTALHRLIRKHHEQAGTSHPEVDLRAIWRELLSLAPEADVTSLVIEAESSWHPSTPMPGAANYVRYLARSGVTMGILSNAQCNSLPALGEIADLLAPELCILSYQYGIAKPSPELFCLLTERLAGRGITTAETLYIGNDPQHDIIPAAAHGFKTALFTGHPDSRRAGDCQPDITFTDWREICGFNPQIARRSGVGFHTHTNPQAAFSPTESSVKTSDWTSPWDQT